MAQSTSDVHVVSPMRSLANRGLEGGGTLALGIGSAFVALATGTDADATGTTTEGDPSRHANKIVKQISLFPKTLIHPPKNRRVR